MSSFGSSYVYGLTFSSFGLGPTGPTGSIGSIGPTGAMGPSRRGNTGNTGPNLINITKVENSYLKYDFSDFSTQFTSTPIIGYTGYNRIFVQGQTAGVAGDFYLLKSYDPNTVDSDGKFPVDVLTFRGFSTTTPDYIKFQYSGENRSLLDISYDLINVGYIGISGGTLGNILQNLPGQFQAGVTSTKYNEDENSILIQHRNIQEGLNIAKPIILNSTIAYWKIDPSQASVFYIAPHGISLADSTEINGLIFFIKRPTYGNLSKGVSLHFPNNFNSFNNKIYYAVYDDETKITPGITFASNFSQNFDFEAVSWQKDSYFCPAANKFNVLNLISLGGRYLAVPVQYNEPNADFTAEQQTLDETCYPFYESGNPINPDTLGNGICCPKSCSASPSQNLLGGCTGYFIPGVGLGSSSLCSRLGSCCIFKDGVYTQSRRTYCDCMTSGLNASTVIWHPFEGLKSSLSSFDCSESYVGFSLGACCNGVGGCSEQTESECSSRNNFFQGLGVLCGNICAGGSGGCCDSGLTCSNGITADFCLSNNRTYLGDRKYCQTFTCSPESISCFQSIPGFPSLKQGDEFAGGIIAGLFTIDSNSPKDVYGHTIFVNHTQARLTTLHNEYTKLTESYKEKDFSRKYRSIFNYLGYGFNSISGNLVEQNESFIIVVAKDDITINSNKEFLWSKKQFMWGPIYDSVTRQYDSAQEDDFWTYATFEGAIFATIVPTDIQFLNLSNRTLTLPSQRQNQNNAMSWLYTKLYGVSARSINGKWSRNYGLENTARLIGSKFLYDQFSTPSYQPDNTITGTTVVDAIIQYNINNPPTSLQESSWFIPSHDEMGYLSNLCQIQNDFNLNNSLLVGGSTPIDGNYWTSTGTFDLTKTNEGLDVNVSPPPTTAWMHSIDTDHPYDTTFNYSIAQSRQNTYKIRPIKIIRCDGRYAVQGQENYKVWRMRLT